jgi:hypothetical protein
MKKIVTSVLLTMVLGSSALMADHEVFVNKTNETMSNGKEVFFGKISDYKIHAEKVLKSLEKNDKNPPEGISQSTWNTMIGTFSHGMTGLGLGLIFGMMDSFVMDFYADQEYVLIRSNGKDFKAITFIGDKNPAMSEADIKALLSKY